MRSGSPPDAGRRTLLRALGAATAGAAAPSLAFAHGASSRAAAPSAMLAEPRGELRVALLLPGSPFDGMSPAAAAFRDGFTLAAEHASGTRIAAQVHDIGAGVSRAMAFARAQRARRSTDIAVAMMSARATPWMRQDLEAAGIPLLVANAGERIVRADAISPAFVYSSLELASAAYASGRWAAQRAGARCALACSYYESGFDMVSAFRAGFEAAGGSVVLSLVSGAPAGMLDAPAVARELADSDAEVVAAFYTGGEAREFFGAYGAREASRQRVVIASPLVNAAETAGVAVNSVATWWPALGLEANRTFVAAFSDRFGGAPELFAMLGYETARMVGNAAPGGARSLADGLRRTGFNGARGAVAMDPRTNEMRASLYLRHIGAGGEESLAALSQEATAGELARALPEQHGWISPYLTA